MKPNHLTFYQMVSYNCIQAAKLSLKMLRKPALTRATHRKSLIIRAIIVNHVIFLHPSKASTTSRIQTLSLPSIVCDGASSLQ